MARTLEAVTKGAMQRSAFEVCVNGGANALSTRTVTGCRSCGDADVAADVAVKDGLPVAAERFDADLIIPLGIFGMGVELASPLGLTDVDPAGRSIAGARKTRRLAERLHQVRRSPPVSFRRCLMRGSDSVTVGAGTVPFRAVIHGPRSWPPPISVKQNQHPCSFNVTDSLVLSPKIA